MTEQQLALIPDTPPGRQPTPRQQVVLDALEHAGNDGLDPQQAGAIFHAHQGRHPLEQSCTYCKLAGTEILKALRKKGLAVERRKPYRRWVSVGTPAEADGGFGEVPY